MLGSITQKLGLTSPPGSAPSPQKAPAESAPALPADTVTTSASPELPSLDAVRLRALADTSAPDAAPEEAHTGLSVGKKAALLGLGTLAAVGTMAGTAQAADLDVFIGPGGVNVRIGDGHYRHRGHGDWGRHQGGYGRHHGGGRFICGPYNNTDGPYREGWGLDGNWHRFDRHNEVNDQTGHYKFTTDIYGNVTGVSCNVRSDGWYR